MHIFCSCSSTFGIIYQTWGGGGRQGVRRTEVRFSHGAEQVILLTWEDTGNELLQLVRVESFCWRTNPKQFQHFEKYGGSWRSHSRAGISRLRAATLSALHLGGEHGSPAPFDSGAEAMVADCERERERETECTVSLQEDAMLDVSVSSLQSQNKCFFSYLSKEPGNTCRHVTRRHERISRRGSRLFIRPPSQIDGKKMITCTHGL